MARVGFLILGQTPRTDIEKTYRQYLPNIEFHFGGALDGLTDEEITTLVAAPKTYPLFAVLNDRSSREIDLYALLPLLELQSERLKDVGVDVIVLMCAGQFPNLNIDLPVIYPQKVVQAIASSISMTKSVRIISPNEGQLPVAIQNWQTAGFAVTGMSASPLNSEALVHAVTQMENQSVPADCLILDCMGFTPDSVDLVRQSTALPVLCPQRLVAKIVAELLNA
ncbi:AroM family protein [Photobacterium sp. DNB23_23_1]|uniref:AroM family protein n=1 Tax=Photobacterium pectinilyticum TaxID=2906793 RepID=A0ABT1N4U3_9GAMM|nr:AroM family protein [Photobacterium sp. ZSDE20]MCQ1058889.1 AroM family protein [Photobacterium sp. ZSDE20]MDD1823821.1 AroM family protein [Photobacterium sp. ZSDE20]